MTDATPRRLRCAARLAASSAVLLALTACAPLASPTSTGGPTVTPGCAGIQDEARKEFNAVRAGHGSSTRAKWLLEDLAARCPREYEQLADDVSRPPGPGAQDGSGNADPAGSIRWSEAKKHVGRRATVCGPLVNDGTSRDDVFLNLGRGYPDQDRFTIVLWDVGAVEDVPRGTTLCVTGIVSLYEGVTQIEVRDPGAVKILDAS